jgi:DNA-binding transcriptional regulator LsrR (DeoR family)
MPKKQYSDQLIMEVLNLWLNRKLSAVQITNRLNLGREEIYNIIKQAKSKNYIRLSPPHDQDLTERLSRRVPAGYVRVVATGTNPNETLETKAAELVIDLIREKGSKIKDRPVRIGLFSGVASGNIVNKLAQMYNADSKLPHIALHALTSGFWITKADRSPMSWFSRFMESGNRVSYVGFYAPPMVPKKLYTDIKNLPEISEAFSLRSQIDIIITSIGHTYQAYWQRMPGPKTKITEKICGDVMYLPYSTTGPVETDPMAFTLFTIRDLVKMADSTKHSIVLVCGRQHEDEKSLKTQALIPLLKNKSLKVWTHLLVDVGTAEDVLNKM